MTFSILVVVEKALKSPDAGEHEVGLKCLLFVQFLATYFTSFPNPSRSHPRKCSPDIVDGPENPWVRIIPMYQAPNTWSGPRVVAVVY